MGVMVIRRYPSFQFKFLINNCLLATLLTLCSAANSGDWLFDAGVTSSLSYIDNVNLAMGSNVESSNVIEFTPNFSVAGEGRQLKAKIDYQLLNIYYSNNPFVGGEDTQNYHRLTAVANSELIERLFYFDAAASVDQQSRPEIDGGVLDVYSVIDYNSTVSKFSMSPYLYHQIGNGLRSELRYRYDTLDGDEDVVNSAIVETKTLALDSGNVGSRWQWSMFAEESDLDYTLQSNQTRHITDFGVSHYSLPRTTFSLHAGTERINYEDNTIEDTGGDYWLLGMDWKPGKRTVVIAGVGERFYGTTYELDVKHNTRFARLNIAYTESVTNRALLQFAKQSLELEEDSDLDLIEGTLFQSLDYPELNTDVFLRKSLFAQLIWVTSKSTFIINASDIDYDYQTTSRFETVRSLQGKWQWRVQSNYLIELSNYLRNRKVNIANASEDATQYTIKISKIISPDAIASISVAETKRTTDDNTLDYTQKRLTISLSVKL